MKINKLTCLSVPSRLLARIPRHLDSQTLRLEHQVYLHHFRSTRPCFHLKVHILLEVYIDFLVGLQVYIHVYIGAGV